MTASDRDPVRCNAAATEVQRAGAQGQRRGAGGQAHALAEELDLDAVALDVAVTEQPDDAAVLQCLEQHGAGVVVERFDANADRLAWI